MTIAVAVVLQEFLTSPTDPRYGYDLMKATGYPSGKLYPILARLNAAGWLQRDREDEQPVDRPARYPYRLTPDGVALARQAVAELRLKINQTAPRQLPHLRPAGGTA